LLLNSRYEQRLQLGSKLAAGAPLSVSTRVNTGLPEQKPPEEQALTRRPPPGGTERVGKLRFRLARRSKKGR